MANQREELQASIQVLSGRLVKLDALIKQRESEEDSEDRKSIAKKERAAKEKEKPKSLAHKQDGIESVRDDSKKESTTKKYSVSELKSLATRVKGQIAVAKQKLAAL